MACTQWQELPASHVVTSRWWHWNVAAAASTGTACKVFASLIRLPACLQLHFLIAPLSLLLRCCCCSLPCVYLCQPAGCTLTWVPHSCHGGLPVAISTTAQPTDQMSAAGPCPSWRTTSGACSQAGRRHPQQIAWCLAHQSAWALPVRCRACYAQLQ